MRFFKVLAGLLCVSLILPTAGFLRKNPIVRADEDPDVQVEEVTIDREDLHVQYDVVDGIAAPHYDVITPDFAEFVYQVCLDYGKEIDVGLLNIPWEYNEQFGNDLMTVVHDNPMLFFVQGFYYYSDNRGIVSKLYPVYLYDEQTTRKYVSAIPPVVEEAMAQIKPGMTDYEKALVLHDWLVDRVEYGFGSDGDECFNLYGALVNRVAVCQGYSQAYCLIARMAGLECGFLSSEALVHAWNYVQIDGKYYNLDATWDDPIPDNLGQCLHRFVLVDNETMANAGGQYHNPDDTFDPALLSNKEFVNAKWVGVDSLITYYNGNWYYALGDEASASSQIRKTSNIYTDAGSVIVEYGSDKGLWTTDDPYGYRAGSYMRAERYNHYLVFNTNSTIEYIDLNSDTYTPTVMYNTADIPYLNPSALEWVFELTVEDTQLKYRAYKIITDYMDPGIFEPGSPVYTLPNVLSQSDPEPKPVTPQPDQDPNFGDFIERLYNVALNRSSEPEGKEYWMNKVLKEGFTGADCARGFLVDTPEFANRGLSDDEFIRVLYRTFFDREADLAGYNYWSWKIQNYMSRREVIEGFIDATEWCNLCARYGVKSGATYQKATIPSKNAVNFATRLYTCCLARDPEADGLSYWSLALTNLDVSGYQAASLFFTLPEFVGLNTTNEEYLTRLYRTYMGREPETDGFAYWLDLLNGGADRVEIMKAFAGCPEFQEICNQYGIARGEIV